MFTCLTLTFLNRSGNPATGSWQHLEKIQCMFYSEFCFIDGILYSSRHDRHDRVLGDLEEGIRGERDEDQQTKKPNSWTLTLDRIMAKK